MSSLPAAVLFLPFFQSHLTSHLLHAFGVRMLHGSNTLTSYRSAPEGHKHESSREGRMWSHTRCGEVVPNCYGLTCANPEDTALKLRTVPNCSTVSGLPCQRNCYLYSMLESRSTLSVLGLNKESSSKTEAACTRPETVTWNTCKLDLTFAISPF
jgi:hypothetical protein